MPKSKFWEQKMRTYFRRLDFNGDGVQTKEDYMTFGRNFAELEYEGSDRKSTLLKRPVELFEMFSKLISPGEELTEERFLEGMIKQADSKELMEALQHVIYVLFVALDNNGDSYIEQEEYITFFRCMELPDYENLSKLAFHGLDTDKDGILNFDEWQSACLDFWYNDENGHGTLFFGPLID